MKPLCDYLCDYSLTEDKTPSYGRLFYAEIKELGDLPDSEIGEIEFFDALPEKLTYAEIQPHLYNAAIKYIIEF